MRWVAPIALVLAGCQSAPLQAEVQLTPERFCATDRVESVAAMTLKCISAARPSDGSADPAGWVDECRKVTERILCPVPGFAIFRGDTQLTRTKPCTQAITDAEKFVCAVD